MTSPNRDRQGYTKWSNNVILAKICGMPKKTLAIFPAALRQLVDLGERLRLARGRRAIGTELFAERMGVSRETLRRLEKGDPTIAMGTYLRALRVLGLDGTSTQLAATTFWAGSFETLNFAGQKENAAKDGLAQLSLTARFRPIDAERAVKGLTVGTAVRQLLKDNSSAGAAIWPVASARSRHTALSAKTIDCVSAWHPR